MSFHAEAYVDSVDAIESDVQLILAGTTSVVTALYLLACLQTGWEEHPLVIKAAVLSVE